MVVKPLYGHTSKESAFRVDSYPYGRLRCKIDFWLEYNSGKGYRFVSQTENPKNGRWNAEKKSTYSLLGGCMFLDENEHVHWSGLSSYASAEEIEKFLVQFPEALQSPELRVFVAVRLAIARRASGGGVVPYNANPSEADRERYRVETEVLERCKALLEGQP